MKAASYATFFAGKWHLGPEGWWPEDQGFDVNMGGIDRGGPYGGKKYFSPYDNPRLADGPDGEHLTDRLATETVKFIEANKDRPFFAYYSFYDVHTPLMAREDLRKKYAAKRAGLGLAAKWGREQESDVRLVQEHAVYAAMVEAMDLAVGKVLAKLDELGLRENTLVEVPVGFSAARLHILGGVAGWGGGGGEAMKVVLHFAGGNTQVAELHSGREFADYRGRKDVPGSQFAEGIVSEHQVRTFAIPVQQAGVIEKLVLESPGRQIAPATVAITAELAGPSANAPAPAPIVTPATKPATPAPEKPAPAKAAPVKAAAAPRLETEPQRQARPQTGTLSRGEKSRLVPRRYMVESLS